jgi:DNA gyrase subunit A
VNILPIPSGVSIAAIMPVDRDEDDWDELQVIFATSAGTVRRNRLSDFANVMRNGKIAMKFEDDHADTRLINARICSDEDDIMLVTTAGRAIRFSSTAVRVFNSRASVGVRGVLLKGDDQVVSMSVIRHFEATPDERAAYLKMRRLMAGVADDAEVADDEEGNADAAISQERYAEMSAAENLLLTITVDGAGKLSSSHDYPLRGRGGQGVMAMDSKMRGGPIISSFPVEMGDQIMLATSTGQSIRVPIEGISFRSRSAGGVRVFNTGKDEKVVSVAYIADQGDDVDEEDGTDVAPDGSSET